jgi:hypothetical protein
MAWEAGRNCHIYFRPAMKERADTRLETETLLRRVLEQDEFELFYQPGKFLGCSSAPASRRTFRCGRREIERTFSHSDFRFDRERNVYVCSADELLKTTGNVSADHMVR